MAAVAGLSVSARSLSPAEALGRAVNEGVAPVSRSGGEPQLVMTVGEAETPAL